MHAFPQAASVKRRTSPGWSAPTLHARRETNWSMADRGVEPHTHQLLNVFDLPTSSEQREVRYTAAELEQILVELSWLQTELYRLRTHWPL